MTTATNPVLHWYDLTCPFCYVGQSRSEPFAQAGFELVELPFQAHPEIPPGGLVLGPRSGPMYDLIEAEARQAGLPLRWPERLPNSRLALALAEWVRRHQPVLFVDVQQALFAAHFALGEDISDPKVIERHAVRAGVDSAALGAALADGSADTAVSQSEHTARHFGVTGTPAWLAGGELIVGLQPRDDYEQIIERYRLSANPP